MTVAPRRNSGPPRSCAVCGEPRSESTKSCSGCSSCMSPSQPQPTGSTREPSRTGSPSPTGDPFTTATRTPLPFSSRRLGGAYTTGEQMLPLVTWNLAPMVEAIAGRATCVPTERDLIAASATVRKLPPTLDFGQRSIFSPRGGTTLRSVLPNRLSHLLRIGSGLELIRTERADVGSGQDQLEHSATDKSNETDKPSVLTACHGN